MPDEARPANALCRGKFQQLCRNAQGRPTQRHVLGRRESGALTVARLC